MLKNTSDLIKELLNFKLIKEISNETVYKYAEELLKLKKNDYFRFQESRIKKELENKVSNLTTEQRIEVFRWWYDNGFTSLPKLLKDDNGNFIEDENLPCFLSSEGIKQIPDWAKSKINIINPQDEDLLIDVF